MATINWPAGVVVHGHRVFFPAGMYITPTCIAPYKGLYTRIGKGERKRNRKNRWC